MRFEPQQVAGQISVILAEAVIGEDAGEHPGHLALRLVRTGLRGAGTAQARTRGVDEHAAVADQVVAEQPAENRVVPGFGQLIVEAQVDDTDIGAFHQRPAADVHQGLFVEILAQASDGFANLFLIQTDPRRRRGLRLLPARLFEALPRAIGDAAEMLAVIVEAGEDHPGDLGGWPLLRHR